MERYLPEKFDRLKEIDKRSVKMGEIKVNGTLNKVLRGDRGQKIIISKVN